MNEDRAKRLSQNTQHSTPITQLFSIDGDLDMHHAPTVRDRLAPLLAAKPASLLVDLTGLTYADSSGLAFFIETLQRVESYGGKFGLFGLRENVRHIFEIARLDQVFALYPDEPSALAALSS